MAFLITNPHGTGTDAELLEIARGMLAQVMLYGHAYDIEGKRVDRSSLKDLRETITWLEARVAAENTIAGNAVNYAQRARAL